MSSTCHCAHPSDGFVETKAALDQIPRQGRARPAESGSAVHCHLLPVGNCLLDGSYAALQLLWCRRREVRHRQMQLGQPLARKRVRTQLVRQLDEARNMLLAKLRH
jgi:hypothetical protein